MAGQTRKSATDPIEILGIRPLCDSTDLEKLLRELGLSPDQIEALHVHLHVFRHKILAAGYEFYQQVPRQPGGAAVLQFLLKAWSNAVREEKDKAQVPPPPPRR